MQLGFQADRIVIAVSATPTEALWSDVLKLLHCLDAPPARPAGAALDEGQLVSDVEAALHP